MGEGRGGNVFKQNLSHLNNKINQSKPIKLTTMLYLITDILLKVALSTNKTDHHVIPYSCHIVESC